MAFWKIQKHIGTFERSGAYTKELNLVSFGNKPAVLDIRAWTEDEAGEKVCCKGLTLTEDGARKLSELLTLYLDTQDERKGEKPRTTLRAIRRDPAPAADPEDREQSNMDKWRAEIGTELEKMYAE